MAGTRTGVSASWEDCGPVDRKVSIGVNMVELVSENFGTVMNKGSLKGKYFTTVEDSLEEEDVSAKLQGGTRQGGKFPPTQGDTIYTRTPASNYKKKERTLFSVVTEKFPSVDQEMFEKVMNEEISDEDVEPYLSLVANMFPYADVRGEWDPKVDWRMSRICDDVTMRQGPYGQGPQRSFKQLWKETRRKSERRFTQSEDQVQTVEINTLYKRKDKKVRPVNANDGTGEGPGGRRDWYERSKARDTPQPQEGKYKEYLLPRIASFPRGSRLTPERLASLDCGKWLWPDERAMFDEMMLNREGAVAFDWKEVTKIHEDVSPPILIKTIPHEAWQEKNFPCPKALFPVVAKMLLERLDKGVLEKCNGPYRNPWFLVAKKVAGTYRLINAAMKMNSVTLRDANMPPTVDEFSEEFAGCYVASLIDFFSGYDQLTLDPRCRDMTAFMTPIGLLRMTTPPQGATNSVAQFVRVVMTILEDLFPDVAMPFLDDIGVKGPYTDYNGELKLPGIRRFVFEHIINLDKTMERIERAGACIGPKSQFCYDGMGIVGFIVGSGGRAPASAKVIKILEWPACKNLAEVRAFTGICVYYRIWIKDFGMIAEPLYMLSKKGQPWVWGPDQDKAMALLKEKLTTAPLLCKIHYDPKDGWGQVVLGVDASLDGWGATLGQYDDKGRLRVARYESGLWSPAERKYDATKRECRGVLKALRKLRFTLYGVHFMLETDANVLVAQLNRAATDLPGALVTRWLAWIRLFDFEVRHVKGAKHMAADGLSRRPRTVSDDDEDEEKDLDEFIAEELECMQIAVVPAQQSMSEEGSYWVQPIGVDETPHDRSVRTSSSNCSPTSNHATQLEVNAAAARRPEDCNPLHKSYSDQYQRIGWFLTTLDKRKLTPRRPGDIPRNEFRRLTQTALNYSVRDHKLWRNATKAYPPRLVLDAIEDKRTVLRDLHDATGHAGRETTYHKVANRYYWENCYQDVRDYVRECPLCQLKERTRHEESLYPTRTSGMFHVLGIDIVKMPDCRGFTSLLLCRDDLSGWPEGKPMKNATAGEIAKFIWTEIICRHGIFGVLKVDGGSEFKGDVIKHLAELGVRRIQISAYNSKGNGGIERGHQQIVDGLLALTEGGKKKWVDLLPTVLFAARTSVHGPTGYTPFYMVYGREAVLPVETQYPSWRTLDWDTVELGDRAKLLELRSRQLLMREADVQEAIHRKNRKRKEGSEYFDSKHRIRKADIEKGDLVLAFDIHLVDRDMSRNTKLLYRWRGPYRVNVANKLKGSYVLEEMDGALLRRTYAGNRLKKFLKRDERWTSPEDTVDVLDDEGLVEESLRDSPLGPRGRLEPEDLDRAKAPVEVPQQTQVKKRKYVRFAEDPYGSEDTDEGGLEG